MARVYRAVGADGQVVALKLVRPELAIEQLFRRRFSRGPDRGPRGSPARRAGAQQRRARGHPVHGAAVHQRRLSPGEAGARGTLELQAAVTLCLEVAKGVGALHAHELIHRDLKPANILLDGEGRAYVADFGLTKDHQASLLTKPGQAVGSLDYMAPEQIRGERVTATDVYSLGCVMFECICGRPPFADRQGMKILWAHLRDEPPDPCATRDVPKGVTWAVLSALQKDPARRPATATAYARMVQAAAGVPPLSPGGGE